MHRGAPAAGLLAVLAVLVACCAGCRSAASPPPRHGLEVVAGENVWGALVKQVGGDHVHVTSLIDSPNADPHEFQAGTRAGLAVATAGVVVVNGAGYDPFMARLLSAAPSPTRQVLTVATVLHATGDDPNPHLWYDAPALPTVVRAIARALSRADPGHAAAYRAGATRTIASLAPLEGAVRALRRAARGAPVAYTERLPGYLLAAAGLRVLTPPAFAHAVEVGIDPSFADIATMRALISGRRIKALLVNRQSVTAITSQLAGLAATDHVPVVGLTETLPAGESFVAWQLAQVQALAAAVG